jgi:hypothetical protein
MWWHGVEFVCLIGGQHDAMAGIFISNILLRRGLA